MKLRSVLLVDDNPFDNEIHTLTLLRAGAVESADQIHVALSGEAALTLLAEGLRDGMPHHPPRLVLVDINMPGMNGFEFMEKLAPWIKANDVDTAAVFMLSSSVRQSDRERATALGFTGYITKPLTRDMALELANRWGT